MEDKRGLSGSLMERFICRMLRRCVVQTKLRSSGTIYRLRPELHSLFFALFELVKFTNSEITSERDAIDEAENINERRTNRVVSEKDSRIFSKSLEKIQQRGKPV